MKNEHFFLLGKLLGTVAQTMNKDPKVLANEAIDYLTTEKGVDYTIATQAMAKILDTSNQPMRETDLTEILSLSKLDDVEKNIVKKVIKKIEQG